MALERVFSKKELEGLKSQIAVPGTDAYKSLDAISQQTLNGATDLAARMVTGSLSEQEITAQKETLTDGLEPVSVKFIEEVINTSRQKVEKAIQDGGTVATTEGLVLWNREEKFSAATMRALEETKYDLSRSNMAELQEYFNYGRVFGALDYEGKTKKLGSKDINKMVDSIMAEHQTSGERTGQKIRKITQVAGTTVGMAAFGLPLAVIGGAGGFLIGGLRRLGHAAFGRDTREAIAAHRRVNTMAKSHAEVQEGFEAIRAYKISYIGKGMLWGAGGLGALGTMAASGFGKGLAGIGQRDKKDEIEAQRIAIRAGIEEGLTSRGISIEEKGNGKAKEEKENKTSIKESSSAQRLASDDERTYAPGEYYYDSDADRRKQMLADIAGALGVEKSKLIENYFHPPQANAYVDIEVESLKKLNGKKAVIAPDFVETEQDLEAQKSLMESYKYSLEKQGRSDIEVVQIKLEGSKTPQWAVVGKDLTAAQVSFAKEMDDEGAPQISVMPKKTEAHAAVADSVTPAAPAVAAETQPTAGEQSVPALQTQMNQLLGGFKELRESYDTMAAQVHQIMLGVTDKAAAKDVTPKQVVENIRVPQAGETAAAQELSGVGASRTK